MTAQELFYNLWDVVLIISLILFGIGLLCVLIYVIYSICSACSGTAHITKSAKELEKVSRHISNGDCFNCEFFKKYGDKNSCTYKFLECVMEKKE